MHLNRAQKYITCLQCRSTRVLLIPDLSIISNQIFQHKIGQKKPGRANRVKNTNVLGIFQYSNQPIIAI